MVNCLERLQFLKGIAYGRMNFYYGQFSCIMLGLSQLLVQISKHILRVSYCAKQDPRIMKRVPCFHRTGGIVGTRGCAVSVWT